MIARIGGLGGIHALAGLAMLSAMGGDVLIEDDEGNWHHPRERRPRRCSYSEPAGPEYPNTRQRRRAMQRKADAALARIATPLQHPASNGEQQS